MQTRRQGTAPIPAAAAGRGRRRSRDNPSCLRRYLFLSGIAGAALRLGHTHRLIHASHSGHSVHSIEHFILSRSSPVRSRSAVAPYEVGTACIGARIPKRNAEYKCTDRMKEHMHMWTSPPARNLTLAQAADLTAEEFPDHCSTCRRADANGNDRYWRLDLAAPPIEVGSGVSHFLSSIPSRARIPAYPTGSNASHLLAHLDDRWNSGDIATREFLFEYNPSLVVLPPGATENLTLPPGETAAYLVSFRVTHANECFTKEAYEAMPSARWYNIRGYAHNYVALALLRADLSIIPGFEIVINLWDSGQSVADRWEPDTLHVNRSSITDYRLFATDVGLYFNLNASPVYLAPFALTSEGGGGGAQHGTLIPNRYGGGFQVVLLKEWTTIWDGGLHGKNFALFQTDEIGKSDEVLVEVDVWPNHRVQRIRLEDVDMMKLSQVRLAFWPKKNFDHVDGPNHPHTWPIDMVRRRRNRVVGNASEPMISTRGPERKFATVEEYWLEKADVFKPLGHGGACCVRIRSEHFRGGGRRIATNQSHLLVGVAHTSYKPHWRAARGMSEEERRKFPPSGTYVSFFYAFESLSPYQIKAMSGYFCLGYGEDGKVNPYMAMARDNRISMSGKTLDCPRIHYVSSVCEKVADDSKMIVSYGINDCVPRMVEMDKAAVARYILEGPEEEPSRTF